MDDSSDTSVTPYEDESASSRGEELEHIDITHLNGGDSEDEQSFNTVREGKHSTQTPDYEERVKGVDPVVPPPRTRFAGAGRSRNNCTVYEAPLRPGTPYSTSTAILALSSLGTRYLRA